jgi:hypothetical protein
MKQLLNVSGLLCAASCQWLCAGEGVPPDKSGYTLFRPTPREWMRDMSTDRPDKTESPYTVDAGHFQVEADILNYSYDRYGAVAPIPSVTVIDSPPRGLEQVISPESSNASVETVAIAPINLKIGLCNSVDFQLVIESYTSVRFHDLTTGAVVTRRGFGDITPRLKWNVWGNDGGSTALALMPFVKLPTNQDDLGNNSVEGGLIVPFAMQLPYDWSMGLMTEFDVVRDSIGTGHHAKFINTITFGHDIVGNLAGYVEFFSLVNAESNSEWVGTVDLGLTFGLTNDIQLDAGVNLGITRSADDINPFLGISWRF